MPMNKFFSRYIVAGALLVGSGNLWAISSCNAPIRGINLVPLPSGWYQGASELQFPTEAHILYYKNVGMNSIRLPITWEVIQPNLYGDLDARYLSHALDFISKAEANGMTVLIDLHNYSRYKNNLIGSKDVPADAFRDIWARLTKSFGNRSAVFAYGLMNEPHDTGGLWHKVAQSGVDGIRSVDWTRPIYVSGDGWSGAQSWPVVNPVPFVKDPANKVVYEAHTYFDDDYSGTYKKPLGAIDVAARVTQRMQPFIDWLKLNNQRGAIGETGVPMGDSRWLQALQKFLDMSDEACLDWFMWAGGGWRESYELSLEPINGVDRPQVKVLRQNLMK